LKTLSSRRSARIFEQIEADSSIKKKPDAIIIANSSSVIDASFFYLTGIHSGLFENSFFIAKKNDGIALFTTPLEESIARSETSGIEIFAHKDTEKNQENLRKYAGREIKTLGLNFSELSLSTYNLIRTLFEKNEIVDIGKAVKSSRAIKDENEVRAIQKACEIASKIYRMIPDLLKDGVSEAEIAAEMAYEMQRGGGSGVSFPSIVAFGKNSALPHYSAGETQLKKGQLVLLDYGTKYLGYCSDITRTLVHGRASASQRRMYDIVKDALHVGTELCTIEHSGAEVHTGVAKLIDGTEYKGRFIHSTGHSLGLDVHDGRALSLDVKDNLQAGMVVTVEPGIYVPSIGGVRIEDDVLITKGKPKVLTTATRELIEA
jgi:Xaa-Pro dipeptidase